MGEQDGTFKVSDGWHKAPWEKQVNEPRPPRWRGRDAKDGTGRHMAEIFTDDQARLNALVGRLNSLRPGRWRQKDAIRYLLDCYEETAGPLLDAEDAS